MNVDDIYVGKPDSAGVTIEFVYTRVPPNYAIYRTGDQVVVHWADDGILSSAGQPLGAEQRQLMAQLAPLRGEINGHLAIWRVQSDPDLVDKCRMYDRRIADALQLALQGDPVRAGLLLTAIKQDLVNDRSSTARSNYLIAATAAALIIITFMSVLDANWFQRIYAFSKTTQIFWFGAGVGALGALFSIALNIRDRTIPVNFLPRDNLIDAGLRIFIGSVSAAIVYALLMSKVVDVSVGTTSLSPSDKVTTQLVQPVAVIIAFVAGFVERLASDLLGRTVVAAFNNAGTKAADAANAVTAVKNNVANETDPMGKTPSIGAALAAAAVVNAPKPLAETEPDDDHVEGCLADHNHAGAPLTQDVELPEATGGVERKPLAAAPANTGV